VPQATKKRRIQNYTGQDRWIKQSKKEKNIWINQKKYRSGNQSKKVKRGSAAYSRTENQLKKRSQVERSEEDQQALPKKMKKTRLHTTPKVNPGTQRVPARGNLKKSRQSSLQFSLDHMI
jgi:hypothetical protein